MPSKFDLPDPELDQFARQREYAKMLRNKAYADTPDGEMVSGIYVPKNDNWGKFINAAVGGWNDARAQGGESALVGEREKQFSDYLRKRPSAMMEKVIPGTPAVIGGPVGDGEGMLAPVTGEQLPSMPATPDTVAQVMKPWQQQQQEQSDWALQGMQMRHPLAQAMGVKAYESSVDIPEKAMAREEAAAIRVAEAKQKHLDRLADIKLREQERRITAAEAQKEREAADLRMKKFMVANRVPPQDQIIQSDQGTFARGRDGKLKPLVTADGTVLTKTTAGARKSADAKIEKINTLNEAIGNIDILLGIDPETGEETKGGVLDKATASGLGSLVDYGAGFFGVATPGAVAGAKAAPLADPILKMVPRFEGPQSDKDTATYKSAAGDLANEKLPMEVRKSAARTIRAIMVKRRGQFGVKGTEDADASPSTGGLTAAEEAELKALKAKHGR